MQSVEPASEVYNSLTEALLHLYSATDGVRLTKLQKMAVLRFAVTVTEKMREEVR